MEKIDATIGQSIRHYRWLQGVTQEDLAAAIGITHSQMRSHEAGKSRVSAARLMAIATHLGVDVTVFFQRRLEQSQPQALRQRVTLRGAADTLQSSKYLAQLMTHFQRLSDVQKQAVLQLVMSISKEGAKAEAASQPQDFAADQSLGQDLELADAFAGASRQRGRDGPY